MSDWRDLGPLSGFTAEITGIHVDGVRLIVTHRNKRYGVLSGVCSHAGGPLEKGHIDSKGYVVCPWHAWTYELQSGTCKPPFDHESTPAYTTEVRGDRLFVDIASKTARHGPPPDKDLAREPKRAAGGPRIVGISTTMMNEENPRYSTSEALLEEALGHAKSQGCETKLLRLRDLKVRPCEGYYSIAAPACTWPCTITQKDPKDEMKEVYEALVHWADIVLVATPIRWGAPSSLYYKMVERLNCVQNQITTHDKVLIRNKVAAFIITGGQDNVQAVAGQLQTFFGELGFHVPQFPFVGHTRGWSAEDMERNVAFVKESENLKQAARSLADRARSLSHTLITHAHPDKHTDRAGRKGSGHIEAPKPQL